VKWQAAEQAAGRGTITSCGMCGGSGGDPEDPSDDCPRCRGVGTVLSETPGQAGTRTPGRAAHDTWCAEDDWDQLDDEARELWEETARQAHAAFAA
jgi:hypothetical protein